MKLNVYLKKIRQFGIRQSIIRILGMIGYPPVTKLYQLYLRKLTKIKENQIIFYSTPSFSDNSKVLFDYLIQHFPGQYHIVWLIHREDALPQKQYPNTEFIHADSYHFRGFTLQALKKTAQSRYVFFTHASPVKEIQKCSGQIVINLWHGCGYKEREQSNKTGIQINPFDFALVPGNVFISTKSKFWGCAEDKILPIGYPRYDLLRCPSDAAKAFCDMLCNGSQKLIVWLPTFRKTGDEKYPEEKINYRFELPLLNDEHDLQTLNQFCQAHSVTLCIKRHPKQQIYQCEKNQYSHIRFISNKDIVAAGIELYSVFQYTHALISDYSSISIDYLLLDKPIAFALEDFEEYKNSRGFVFDDPKQFMPGHHLYGFADLQRFITEVTEGLDPYSADRKNLLPEVHHPCGNYCERVWNTVQSLTER